jgi:hypothetical protein
LSIQGIRPGLRLLVIIHNKLIFYGEGLLAPRPTPKLEDDPLSAVRDCLFNIFTATLHPAIFFINFYQNVSSYEISILSDV